MIVWWHRIRGHLLVRRGTSWAAWCADCNRGLKARRAAP